MTRVCKPAWVSDLGINGYGYGYDFCVPAGICWWIVTPGDTSFLYNHHHHHPWDECKCLFQLISAHHRHQHLSTGHHHCKIGGHPWHFNRALLMQKGGYKVTRCALHFFISFYILTLSLQNTFWMCWGGYNPPLRVILSISTCWGGLDPLLRVVFYFDMLRMV